MSPVAALDHVRQDRVDGAEDGVDVQRQHPVPGVRVAVEDVAADVGAGVGVEDVEAAGALEDPGQHAADARRVGEIDGEAGRPVAQFGAERVEAVLRAVDEDDGGPGREGAAGAGEADAGGGAGDRDDLAAQGLVHGSLSPAWGQPGVTASRYCPSTR